MTTLTKNLQPHWVRLQPYLTLQTERDYATAIQHLNELLDEVGDNEQHPLYGLLDTLGTLIQIYEEQHQPIPDCSGAEALQFLLGSTEVLLF